MATAIVDLIAQARKKLLEESEADDSFWTDDELYDIARHGIQDLWGRILDVHGEHYITIDETNVTLAASTGYLSGVPTDVFRVLLIEPRDTTTSGNNRRVMFFPRKYNHPDMINARTRDAMDPTVTQDIYYTVSGAGAPTGAPTIYCAPQISDAMNIRLVYNPTIEISATNPIPGQSDHALIHWIAAHARAKEREDRSPDPNLLAIYTTEKENVLVRITPRQEQETECVEDLFKGWGNY